MAGKAPTTRKRPSGKTPLRSVPPPEEAAAMPEPPQPTRAQTLLEAIEAGVYLDILKAQRREMVRDVKDERGPAKAAMHRQIALLSKEIAALEAEAAVAAEEESGGGGSEDADEAFDPEAL